MEQTNAEPNKGRGGKHWTWWLLVLLFPIPWTHWWLGLIFFAIFCFLVLAFRTTLTIKKDAPMSSLFA
jgi:hypothetical protein